MTNKNDDYNWQFEIGVCVGLLCGFGIGLMVGLVYV